MSRITGASLGREIHAYLATASVDPATAENLRRLARELDRISEGYYARPQRFTTADFLGAWAKARVALNEAQGK